MRVRAFVDVDGRSTYPEQLRMARCAEDGGFDGFFRTDRYPDDAWLTLAALARETSRIRLGTLVTPATYREPAALASAVAQVDRTSGGRVELGLGAGRYAAEHEAYGLEFPSAGTRFDRLAEQLEILTGLWATPEGGRYTFHGDRYRLLDVPASPAPAQRPGPPLIIGGRGPKRTPELAARFAAEYNVAHASVERTARRYEAVLDACTRLGRARPPAFSATLRVYCGRSVEQLAYRCPGGPGAFCGTPARVVDRIGGYAAIGASVVYLRLDLRDLDHVTLLAAEVLPQLS